MIGRNVKGFQDMMGLSVYSRLSTTLILLILALSGCKPEPVLSGLPNIVLVCLESVRADHLGCYGYDRDTSPVMDSLASCGVLWTDCQSQSSWTLPSFASLWTGLSTQAHRAGWVDGCYQPLDLSLPTIASLLKVQGYATAGFMGCFLLGRRFGFDRGFDHFAPLAFGNGIGSYTMSKAIAWLDSNVVAEDRFLLTVHLFDPHPPHDPPEPYRSMWADSSSDSLTTWWTLDGDSLVNPGEAPLLISLYDGEIRYVDDQIRLLCDHLRSTGLADSTIIIITSDYGEEFLDHGWIGNSHSLYHELLHVPLIISGPGVPSGERRDGTVGLLDIFPTIAGLVGAEIPMNVEGLDLFSDSLPDQRAIPAGSLLPDTYARGKNGRLLLLPVQTVAITMDNLKLVWDMLTNSMLLFDLTADPLEMTPLAPEEGMVLEIERYMATPPQCSPKPLVDEPLRDPVYLL
jgi:arylsulfatase A-like enzyme